MAGDQSKAPEHCGECRGTPQISDQLSVRLHKVIISPHGESLWLEESLVSDRLGTPARIPDPRQGHGTLRGKQYRPGQSAPRRVCMSVAFEHAQNNVITDPQTHTNTLSVTTGRWTGFRPFIQDKRSLNLPAPLWSWVNSLFPVWSLPRHLGTRKEAGRNQEGTRKEPGVCWALCRLFLPPQLCFYPSYLGALCSPVPMGTYGPLGNVVISPAGAWLLSHNVGYVTA